MSMISRHMWLSVSGVALAVMLLFLVYSHAKSSFFHVGYNDGLLAANSAVLQKLREQGSKNFDCKGFPEADLEELVSVKGDAVYLIKSGGALRMCEYLH